MARYLPRHGRREAMHYNALVWAINTKLEMNNWDPDSDPVIAFGAVYDACSVQKLITGTASMIVFWKPQGISG